MEERLRAAAREAGASLSIASHEFALVLDEVDPLAKFRGRFYLPQSEEGRPALYLCGNSLGCMPMGVRDGLMRHCDAWATHAVDAHFEGEQGPWMPIEDEPSELSLGLVGAKRGEVVYMNSLSVNLHLMMVAFYRPTPQRHRILIEDKAFPSDEYVVQSQVRFHGYDPANAILRITPRQGEHCLREEDIKSAIMEHRDSLALILLPGVQYYTGQVLPIASIAALANRENIPVGFDLAHAVGNVELQLHDWGVDFAAWCTYKYLNSGPGALAGLFLHERHAENWDLQRFGGWWGHDRDTRFQMGPDFVPQKGAYGFQLSNPSVFAIAPVIASLKVFEDAGMCNIRRKSVILTGYLEYLITHRLTETVEVITPFNPSDRGSQLSLRFRGASIAAVHRDLSRRGVVCDTREPDVMRVAPAPLYNSFAEVWRFVDVLVSIAGAAAV